jgi:hypothetical protein
MYIFGETIYLIKGLCISILKNNSGITWKFCPIIIMFAIFEIKCDEYDY